MANSDPDYNLGLWKKFLSGDEKAISNIYIRYVNELFDYGCKFSLDRELIKDCIQEVFISLIRNRKNLSTTVQLKGYLYKAVKRKIISELIKSRRFEEIIQSEDYKFEIKLLDLNNEDYKNDNYSKRVSAVQTAIDSLTSRQKEALYLRFYRGMGHKEMATVLHLSNQSSRALLSRALNKIKEVIDSEKKRISQILYFYFKQIKRVL